MALNIKANHFDSQVRERGRQYFRNGAVHIQRGDAWSVLAAVDGSDRYEVCLTRQDGHLKVGAPAPISTITCRRASTSGPRSRPRRPRVTWTVPSRKARSGSRKTRKDWMLGAAATSRKNTARTSTRTTISG